MAVLTSKLYIALHDSICAEIQWKVRACKPASQIIKKMTRVIGELLQAQAHLQ